MFGFGVTEIVIFIAILVLLFGAKQIPVLARSLGEAARHIRSSFSEGETQKDRTDKKE